MSCRPRREGQMHLRDPGEKRRFGLGPWRVPRRDGGALKQTAPGRSHCAPVQPLLEQK